LGLFNDISNYAFRDLHFSQFQYNIYRFNWLNADFTHSYNFIASTLMPIERREGRIKTISRKQPEAPSYEDRYCIEYLPDDEQMFLTLNDKRYEVSSIKLLEEPPMAAILELTAHNGAKLLYYGTKGEPFSALFLEKYGLNKA